jgi:hypothetical protein
MRLRKRQQDLIQAGLDLGVDERVAGVPLAIILEPKQEQLVPQRERVGLERLGQRDRNVRPHPALPHFLGETPALERAILKKFARRDEFRTEDRIRGRIVFMFARQLTAQDRKAARIAVVQNLHDFGALVAEAKITFVNHQRAAKRIQDAE